MPKKPSSKVSDQEDEIYTFLKKNNRPFSTNELSNYFQGKYTKSAIQKALDKLFDQQLIINKVFGKITIYTLKQESFSEEEDQQLDTKIEQLHVQLNTIQEKVKEHQQILKQLVSVPTTEQAKYQLEQIKIVNEKMSYDLENWKKELIVNIPLPEQETINKEFTFYRKAWKERKSLFYEILDAILENISIKKNVLLEEIDFEDDPIPFNQDPLIM